MTKIWQLTQAEFVGDHPLVEEDLEEMDVSFGHEIDWLTQCWLPASLKEIGSDLFLADIDQRPADVALVARKDHGSYEVVGGYCETVLWVAKEYRGRKLAVELVLEAAARRGCDMQPEAYTPAGYAAHKLAHEEGVRRALLEGQHVTDRVLMDYPELLDRPLMTFDSDIDSNRLPLPA